MIFNSWLHFTNNNFSTPTSIQEILDQPIFLNSHTKLNFSSDNPYFYCIPPRNISDKFTIFKDLFRFLQPSLVFSTLFDKKLGFPTTNHKITYKQITTNHKITYKQITYKLSMDLIPIIGRTYLELELLKNPF